MKMEISKQDFEDAILVATSSHSEVFDSVKPHFLETYNLIKRSYLSDIGAKFFDETESFQPFLKRWVCLATFANVVRHLDLVLTPTGFGVVSNGEVTPASSARVENLIEQVSQAILAVVEECVCALAVNASGWGKTMQAKRCIPTLLWGYQDYKLEASLSKLSSQDWHVAQNNIRLADDVLRRIISNEQMDAFLDKCRTGEPWTEQEQKAVCLIRTYLALDSDTTSFKPNDMKHTLDRLRLLLDGDAEAFAPYHASSEYKCNHYKPYENRKSAPAYIFNS